MLHLRSEKEENAEGLPLQARIPRPDERRRQPPAPLAPRGAPAAGAAQRGFRVGAAHGEVPERENGRGGRRRGGEDRLRLRQRRGRETAL